MKFLPEFVGKVERGQLVLTHPDQYSAYLKRLEGKDVLVMVDRLRANRSYAQNKRHWGLLVDAIVDASGYDKAAVHRLLRKRFLTLTEPDFDGTATTTIKSSADLKSDEFNEFMRDVEIFSAEQWGIEIPHNTNYEN